MRSIVLLLGLPLLACPLFAQVPQRLSLEEALRIAEEHNPEYRSTRSGIEVAEAEVRQSRGAFLPAASAYLSFNGTASRTLVAQDPFGSTIRADSAIVSTSSYASQGLNLSMPLIELGRMSELRASHADEHAAMALARNMGNQVRAEVARSYYAALLADRLAELEERLLASARERLEATQRLFRVAALGRVEVLGAEADIARQEQALDQARAAAKKAKLSLMEAMGVNGAATFALVTEPPPVFDPSGLDVDSLVALALGRNPRVEEAEAGRLAAAHRVSAARGKRWPTLSASALLSRSGRERGYDAYSDLLDPSDRALGFGISLSLPLFSGSRTSYAIAQATAARTRAEDGLRAARLAVEQEARSALVDLESVYRSTQLAEHTAELSRERLGLAREQYQHGAIRFTDLQAVVDRSAEAAREAENARFTFATALVTLEEKVSAPIRP